MLPVIDSALIFKCQSCRQAGSRNESYQGRPGHTPSFTDVCPKCGSQNIDIVDRRVPAHARFE